MKKISPFISASAICSEIVLRDRALLRSGPVVEAESFKDRVFMYFSCALLGSIPTGIVVWVTRHQIEKWLGL